MERQTKFEAVGGFVGLVTGAIIGMGAGIATGGAAIAATVPFAAGGGGIGATAGRWIEKGLRKFKNGKTQ